MLRRAPRFNKSLTCLMKSNGLSLLKQSQNALYGYIVKSR